LTAGLSRLWGIDREDASRFSVGSTLLSGGKSFAGQECPASGVALPLKSVTLVMFPFPSYSFIKV
jgi:hypothetical protein